MATSGGNLEKHIKNYIKALKPASDEFKQQLKATEPTERHRLLMEVRGGKHGSDTCVIVGAHLRDLPALKCMLDGMNQEQKFNILKVADHRSKTPLHTAVGAVTDLPYSSEVAKELINNLSRQQLYHLLEMKTNTNEQTVLHYAVYFNRVDLVPGISARITRDQTIKLLSIKDAEGTTPADLSVPTLFSTVQELQVAQEKVTGLERELTNLDDKCRDLEEENAKHTTVIAEQENELAVQKNELAEQGRAMKRMASRLEQLEKKLEIFLQIPIGTSGTEEQLNEESVSSAARNG